MVVPRHFHGGMERPHFARRRGGDRLAGHEAGGMTDGWRPGDRRPDPASMLRVNQAGEYGATRIYDGQLAGLGGKFAAAPQVALRAAQERRHLERFDRLMADRRIRPTALQPLWNIAGFALGAATALISEKA